MKTQHAVVVASILVLSFALGTVVHTASSSNTLEDRLRKLEDTEASRQTLVESMRAQTRENGSKLYSPLVAISLMVFYVFALQCVSTVAIVRRETNSWKWPVFQWFYMAALAWVFAFVTYQAGKLLGFAG